MACNCAEGKIDEKPNNLGAHNCEYIAKRNLLIEEAEKHADKVVRPLVKEAEKRGEKIANPRGTVVWSLTFHRQMNELAKSL